MNTPKPLKPESAKSVSAYQQALGLLVRREHSRRELQRKLQVKGADPGEAELALDKLVGQGFQDDARYAQAFARSRAHAGYGPVRIRAELSGHRLDTEQIQAALDACETDWTASAREIVARRCRPEELAESGKRRKVIEFLLRRGFEQDDAYRAVRACSQAALESPE